MTRTYIKLNVQLNGGEAEGGIYLDSISSVFKYNDKGRTSLVTNANHIGAIINKPLAEVEHMLANANAKQSAELDWRDISGKPQKPVKAPQAPKEGLAKRFHLKR